jgi:hypothetical protein
MTDYLRLWLFWLIVWNTALFTAYVLQDDCRTRGVLALAALTGTAIFAIARPDDSEEQRWLEEECVTV